MDNLSQIESKIQYIQKLFNELCQGMKDCQDKTAATTAEKEDLVKKLEKEQEKLENLSQKAEAEIKQLRLQGETEKAEAETENNKKIEEEQRKNQAKIDEIQSEINRITTEKENTERELRENIIRVENESAKRVRQLEEASESQKASAAEELSQAIGERDIKIAQLNARISELETQNKDCTSKLRKINEDLGKLSVCSDDLNKKFDKVYLSQLMDRQQTETTSSGIVESSQTETVPPREELEPVSSTDTETTDVSLTSSTSQSVPDPHPYRSTGGGRKRKTKRKKTKRKKSKKSRRKSRKRR